MEPEGAKFGRGSKKWFFVNSKSFEVLLEGERRQSRVFIIERSRGFVSWIRFGEEGVRNLLKGIEICGRDIATTKRSFDWKENGRIFRLDSKKNDAGRFLLCFVTDEDGKRHKLFFPEGRGLVNGWSILVKKLCGLGLVSTQGEKKVFMKEKVYKEETTPREFYPKWNPLVETTKVIGKSKELST